MKKQKWINQKSDKLFAAVLTLKNLDEARRFFRDLLTEPEIEEFSARFQVAQMLYEGVPYSEIEKKTGMSSTTIARTNKWVKSGMGGYLSVFKKLENQKNHHSPA